jgi:hypothetical protein
MYSMRHGRLIKKKFSSNPETSGNKTEEKGEQGCGFGSALI